MLPKVVTAIPGPESLRLAGKLRRHESRNVTWLSDDWPVFWEKAEGVNVWDADGNRYLDLTSAFAVAGLGHGRAELRDAMVSQAGQLMHGMGDVHPSRLKVELCARLSEITFERWGLGDGKTVLSSSGFEAVETALKTALLATERKRIVSFKGAYHGLGYGALMGAGMDKFRAPFRDQLNDLTTWMPFPRVGDDLELWKEEWEDLDEDLVGAVLVEPIQGRAGEIVPPAGFLTFLREWCDAHGALLIFDEIYTGFHRAGALFACDHEGVYPDLLCLGKALSGGFPISACVGRAVVMDAWPESDGEALHTSTFLGNPVGCAMALEAIRLHLAEETVTEVAALGALLEERLGALGARENLGIREVRGRGLMWGLEFEDPAVPGRVAGEMLKAGFLMLPGGSKGEVLSFTPPFALSEEELDLTLAALRSFL